MKINGAKHQRLPFALALVKIPIEDKDILLSEHGQPVQGKPGSD